MIVTIQVRMDVNGKARSNLAQAWMTARRNAIDDQLGTNQIIAVVLVDGVLRFDG